MHKFFSSFFFVTLVFKFFFSFSKQVRKKLKQHNECGNKEITSWKIYGYSNSCKGFFFILLYNVSAFSSFSGECDKSRMHFVSEQRLANTPIDSLLHHQNGRQLLMPFSIEYCAVPSQLPFFTTRNFNFYSKEANCWKIIFLLNECKVIFIQMMQFSHN